MGTRSGRAMLCFLLLWQTCANFLSTSGTPGEKHVYGKYFASTGDDMDNSLYVWRADNALPVSPAVVYYHPGGFVGMQPYIESNDVINSWTRAGFVYISVGYRLTPTRYYYNDTDGSQKLEEFVNLLPDGDVQLNQDGKTMADWKVYAGRQDVITKCMYDAKMSMNWIVENQELLGIDPMRLVFQTGSAGTGISNYLTYTYQRLFPGRIHTAALIYSSAQLNYPVEGILAQTQTLIANTMALGWDTPLSDFIEKSSCYQELCNVACPDTPVTGKRADWQYDLCNTSWNRHRMATYCDSDGFKTKTLGDLYRDEIPYPEIPWRQWGQDEAASAQHERIGDLLWTISNRMKDFPHGADFIYVANPMNGTSTMDLPHMPSWARSYADLCKEIGCKYTVYYPDYTGMKPPPSDSEVVFSNSHSMKWNYEGNFDWRHRLSDAVDVQSQNEQVLFGCFAVGMECHTPGYNYGQGSDIVTFYEQDLPKLMQGFPTSLAFIASVATGLTVLLAWSAALPTCIQCAIFRS